MTEFILVCLTVKTNWDLNKAINVLDIHELSEGVQKPMMDLLLKDLWEEVKRDRNEPVGLIVDELWKLADKKYPQTMEFEGTWVNVFGNTKRRFSPGCYSKCK